MTTELEPDRQNGRAAINPWNQPAGRPDAGPGSRRGPAWESAGHARRRRGLLARHPAWPIVAMLAGYPLWWALGIADYMFIVFAIPMAWRLRSWHRGGRPLRLPPGFSLWLLFLVCTLAGVVTLGLAAPDSVASPLGNRIISWADRSASYAAVTVLLLFAGNLTGRELSRRRLAWLLGLVGIFAVVGGVLGVLLPHFQFTSPLALVMPRSFRSNTLVQSWLHPGFAQVQGVLGTAKGRPKAPFDYTNDWGDCLSILLPWLLVAWGDTRKHRRRALAIITVALVPVVYSLDRGLWIGIGVAVVYLGCRYAARGKTGLLAGIGAGFVIIAIAILASPLHTIISERLANGNSDQIRSSLSVTAVKEALASPLIGYGDGRHVQGSANTIAAGPTANCIQCGQADTGSNGQLWLLLVCSGFVGTAFYLAFFGYGIWRYRRDRTPYGMAGVLALLLSFVYMFTYVAVVAPLAFTMLAYALLWRNDTQQLNPDAETPTDLAASAGRGSVRRPAAYRAIE